MTDQTHAIALSMIRLEREARHWPTHAAYWLTGAWAERERLRFRRSVLLRREWAERREPEGSWQVTAQIEDDPCDA